MKLNEVFLPHYRCVSIWAGASVLIFFPVKQRSLYSIITGHGHKFQLRCLYTDINYEGIRFMFYVFKTQKTLHDHITHAGSDRIYASLGETKLISPGEI